MAGLAGEYLDPAPAPLEQKSIRVHPASRHAHPSSAGPASSARSLPTFCSTPSMRFPLAANFGATSSRIPGQHGLRHHRRQRSRHSRECPRKIFRALLHHQSSREAPALASGSVRASSASMAAPSACEPPPPPHARPEPSSVSASRERQSAESSADRLIPTSPGNLRRRSGSTVRFNCPHAA